MDAEEAVEGTIQEPQPAIGTEPWYVRRVEEARNDPRSNESLIQIALSADEDTAWEAISLLQFRGNRKVFEAARKLCESNNANERRLSADILGQLGIPDRAFPDDTVELLLDLLENEEEVTVLNSVAVALGHIKSPRAIEPLSRLKNHPHEDVRYGVVIGLLTHEDDLAIETLIELSTDQYKDVRDWATFGLGSMIDTDTKDLRNALANRLTDEDEETRAEALVGLARRKDERILDVLIERLSADSIWSMSLEAAAEMGHVSLCPALLELKQRWQGDNDNYTELLEKAIIRCGCEDTSENTPGMS